MKYIQVFSTTASKKSAQNIANVLVEKKLAACVQILGPIKSVYQWKGKIEKAKEFLLLIKSNNSKAQKIIKDIDGLITNQKNLVLTIATADCLPIYFYDFEKEVIGIAHAGWKGVASNIAKEMVKKMAENYKSNPENILIYIGPHIRKCHFEVQNDVAEKFNNYQDFIIKKDSRIFIDLLGITKKQLVKLSIKEENIGMSNECTYCEDKKYFSFRRDKPEKTEAMLAYIGLK